MQSNGAGFDGLRAVVAQVVEPMMKGYGIPGMAVRVVADGHECVYDFGVDSKATRKRVDADTL
jgi:beta-lactamase class C